MTRQGPNVKHRVKLAKKEREYLLEITRYGNHPAREIHRAHILLMSDRGVSNTEIELALQASRSTIVQVQQRYVKKGFKTSLIDKKRNGRPKTWTKKDRALLLKLVETSPPDGKKRWTLRSLKQRFLEVRPRPSLSHEMIRQILQQEQVDWTQPHETATES